MKKELVLEGVECSRVRGNMVDRGMNGFWFYIKKVGL